MLRPAPKATTRKRSPPSDSITLSVLQPMEPVDPRIATPLRFLFCALILCARRWHSASVFGGLATIGGLATNVSWAHETGDPLKCGLTHYLGWRFETRPKPELLDRLRQQHRQTAN